MKLCCCCSLWRYLDTELLNANPVHHAGTTKGSAVDRTPALAEEKYCLFRLLFYHQVEWRPPRYTLGVYEFSNRLPGLRDMPIGRRELIDFL